MVGVTMVFPHLPTKEGIASVFVIFIWGDEKVEDHRGEDFFR